MSRIYDVLKRADEGRPAYTPIGIGEEEQPVVIPAAGPMPQTDAAGDSPVTLDAVLAQCIPTTWRPNTGTMLFFSSAETAEGTEQFRTLRSQLYQLRETQSLRKILVASALPKEGRSFIAANLAQAMARQTGSRSLLIDADFRNPSLHAALGTSSTPGLAEYLLGEASELGIIQRGQIENLFFIASGRPVSGQAELLCNGRMKLLLDRLAHLYDWIIIDSPAAMSVSDSWLISNFCDGVLMVVRSNATPFDVVSKAQQKFSDEKMLGVVLNGTPSEIPKGRRHNRASTHRSVLKVDS